MASSIIVVCGRFLLFLSSPSAQSVFLLLTNNMSATRDQHVFSAIIAKKTKEKLTPELWPAVISTKYTNGAETKAPKPQIMGSHSATVVRYLWAMNEPKGTPIRPASIAMTPNRMAMLQLDSD